MKKTTVKDIELGNLIFGNSRGKYVIEDRKAWQDPFCEFLRRNGFDMYGYYERGTERCFENDTFIIRPYYWGEDDDIAVLPNFEYKPTGFAISWYKYPLRNAFANQDITTEEFLNILDDCKDAIRIDTECVHAMFED